jgi:GH25 family lysozyme M1 (1,4-beta-N-acetylmuramidase)
VVKHADWLSGTYYDNPWLLEPGFAGIVVVIDHGDGRPATIYAHMNDTHLNVGDVVEQGQIIGHSGNTRTRTSSFAPHLHWELMPDKWNIQNGTYGRVNPMDYVGGTPAPAPAASPVTAVGMLKGVDISLHQKGINVGALGASAVVIKASEGVGYVDPEFVSHLGRARAAGVAVGYYHMARPFAESGNTAQAEADSFLSIIAPHFQPQDELFLDWEMENVHRTDWAKEWLDIVNARLGKRPVIYMNLNESRQPGWDAVKASYPLWLAQYPSSSNQGWGPIAARPSTPGWTVYGWQYSSTGQLPGYGGALDINEFYLWNSSGSGVAPAATPKPVASGSSRTVTNPVAYVRTAPRSNGTEVAAYKGGIAKGEPFGVIGYVKGEDPYNKGDDAWYKTKSGYFVWANAAGNDLSGLQYLGDMSVSQAIVTGGDTLTSIADQFGVPLQQVINANPGININVIKPGQVINLR